MWDNITLMSYLQCIEALLHIASALVPLTCGGIKLAPPVHEFILLKTQSKKISKQNEQNITSKDGLYISDITSLIQYTLA